MIARLHAFSGFTAMLLIAVFQIATIVSELTGDHALIVQVKTAIPWGFVALIPALAATGGSGFSLAKGRTAGLVGKKQARMKLIAANGLLVLVPAALFLAWKASHGVFDAWFYGVRAVEIVFGLANLALLGMNARDGFKMTRRKRAAA